MSTAKVVRLDLRPIKRAHLVFALDGVLGEVRATIGQGVTPFDFAALYADLGAAGGEPARLRYDSAGIGVAVAGSTLMALRAEARKAALDSAVAARANAYYGKYANQAEVIAMTNRCYAPGVPGSKPNRLDDLAKISRKEAHLLQDAYKADGRLGVVKTTTSTLTATTSSIGDSGASDTIRTLGTDETDSSSTSTTTSYDAGSAATSGEAGQVSTSDKTLTTMSGTGTDLMTSSGVATAVQTSSGQTQTISVGASFQKQGVTNTDYGYRVPSLENLARNQRSQISLMDEAFAQFMANQNLPYLPKVFGNELAMIDLGVKQLQVAYLDTILMSPIDGVVTGIYKTPGDYIRRGEVVMRVEDNRSVYLAGIIVCRDAIKLGDPITVKTAQLSNPANMVSISGKVVGARGHRSNDDWWAVVASCDNLDGAGDPIFPLNYHFDFDNTTVTVS